MKGIVVQFRRGRKTVKERHFLLDVGFEKREEAMKVVGKDVEWKSPSGKVIKGKVSSAHGNKGLIRVIFEKGLPGQAVTTEVKLTGEATVKDKKAEKKEAKEAKKDDKKEVKGEKKEEEKKEEIDVNEKKEEEK